MALERIPFGIASLDIALLGGPPKGHYSLVVGPPRSGKTVVTEYLVTSFLNTDPRSAVYYDQEGKFNETLADNIKMDLDRVEITDGETAEIVTKQIEAIAKNDKGEFDDVGFVALDSIYMTLTEAALNDEKKAHMMAPDAHVFNEFFRHLARRLARRRREGKPLTIVAVNHEAYGKPAAPTLPPSPTWPGGREQRFAAASWVRLGTAKLSDGLTHKGMKLYGSLEMKATIRGNLDGPTGTEAFMSLRQFARDGFPAGTIDDFRQLWVWGRDSGYIGGGGKSYAVGNRVGFNGENAIVDYWIANPDQYLLDRQEIVKLAIGMNQRRFESGQLQSKEEPEEEIAHEE